jgi:hypothetical protein
LISAIGGAPYLDEWVEAERPLRVFTEAIDGFPPMCKCPARARVLAMRAASEIADELRDEVLQTILAVRLNLAHSIARHDCSGVLRHAAEAQDHLAAEAERVRSLIARLESLEAVEPDAVA